MAWFCNNFNRLEIANKTNFNKQQVKFFSSQFWARENLVSKGSPWRQNMILQKGHPIKYDLELAHWTSLQAWNCMERKLELHGEQRTETAAFLQKKWKLLCRNINGGAPSFQNCREKNFPLCMQFMTEDIFMVKVKMFLQKEGWTCDTTTCK